MIMRESDNTVGLALQGEKQTRDDTSRYVGELLVRQRLINTQVVSFSQELFARGSTVIDACAGPEGSFLSAALCGYRWTGNEIAYRFARNLKNSGAEQVVISDFADSPFGKEVVDGVFFIFALNNISYPNKALAEAGRVTKQNGGIVIADPGLTFWQTNILLCSVLPEEQTQRMIGHNCCGKIRKYFEEKPYSLEEYCEFVLRHNLGMTQEELSKQVNKIVEENSLSRKREKRIVFYFHQEAVRAYYGNLAQLAIEQGFNIEKVGIMATARLPINGTEEWAVASPSVVDHAVWLEELVAAKEGKTVLIPSDFLTSPCKLIFPVICFKKK